MTYGQPYTITMREGSCDKLVFDEVWEEDVYRLNNRDHRDLMRGRPALDLGANVGAFTLRALDVGATRVYAVEPYPGNVERLLDNVAHSPDVIVYEGAVVGANGPDALTLIAGDAKFPSISYQTTDAETIALHAGQNELIVNVPTFPLDSLLEIEPEWGVLKCDIEGAEFAAFEGVQLLDRVHFITMEFHGRGMGQHCAWIEDGSLGRLVETLTETHHVQTLGAASRGGMIYARRY